MSPPPQSVQSLGIWQRVRLWGSPAPLSRVVVPWGASTCTTSGLRLRPPSCPWLRAGRSGLTRSVAHVCSSAEAWPQPGSTWACLTYSRATRGSTSGSWVTERRTDQMRPSWVDTRRCCWLKVQVGASTECSGLKRAPGVTFRAACLCCRENLPLLSPSHPAAPDHLCSCRTSSAGLQLDDFRAMCESVFCFRAH